MKQKKWLLTTLTACAVAFSAAFVGCKKNSTEKPLEEGPETGTYYLEDEFGENLLTLSGGEYFTFTYRGKDASGTYTLEDGVLTLDFNKDEDGEATGAFEDATVSITYNGASLRLLRKKYYQVTFETNGGSQVAAKAVLNGKTLAKPADPEKAGNKFIAWYTTPDCSGMPFSFETDAVTEDTKLYALWAPYDAASAEFEVKFDLGYDGKTLASATTVGGKLYNVVNPVRDGYVFNGWWMSSYNDGAKLTAEYTADYAFAADTTLFALWTAEGENAMLLSVDVNGAKWTGVTKAATITVEGPNGLKSTETVGTTAGNAYGYDFSTKPAGDYKVTLESDGKKVERYYLNNALLRASGFRVVGNAVLMFNPVAGAEKYLVSVDCGDARHNHTEVDNGLSTNFNFVNCPMKKGGIVFTVKAVAAGKASSVATYTFDRTLAKVENLAYNAENGLLTWNAVREAAEYVVCVGDEEFNVGNNTEFSLKGYTGELEIKVVCKTDGYNESEAAELTLDKTTPVAPANLAVNGDDLTWDAAENATGYVVRIGSNEYETADATFALGEKIRELVGKDPKGQDFTVAVKAKFETVESLWSDALDMRYYALDKSLKYDRGVLTWNYVVGATEYEVTVNGKAYKTASNEYAVTLTQAGDNVLTVKFATADGADDETATYTVYAYKFTFDAMQGEKVDIAYKAVGDPMNLPTTTREGYNFAGWYNSASATGVNGKQYSEEYFYGSTDLVLYAGWTPKTYSAQLEYGEEGEGADATADVVYTKDYNITPPTVKAEHNDKVFAGWFSSADGKGGIQYTDELGNSLRPWQHTADNIKLYAVYKDAYKYSLIGGDYELTANPLLAGSKLTELTVPATHDGKKVVSIGEYAFQNFKNLVKINIPDSVTFIASTAFYGCTKIETYAVYTPAGATPVANPAYIAVDGSLLYNNKITGETELVATPSVLTGAYTIPYGVTRLGSRNFYKSGLTEIIVPASVTEVAKEAFIDCKNLTKVTFRMPEGEQKLVSLTLAGDAISGCDNLETLELPARLKEIANVTKAFNAFRNLKEINVTGECEGQVYSSLTEKDGAGANGILTNGDKSEIIFCPLKKEFNAVTENNNTVYEFVVPNIVTKIGAHAFDMYRQSSEIKNVYYALNKVTFHAGMVSIGENAFYNLNAMRTVEFGAGDDPLGLTIGESAFEGCRLINTITFGETAGKVSCVKEIGKKAFYDNCVESLVLPSSLEVIGESAFEDCDNLADLDLSKVSSDLRFGAYAFAECNGLTSVEITDNVGEMEFSSVFYKCRNLQEVIVPATNPNFESVDGVLYSKGRETILYYPSGLSGNYTLDPATKRIGGGVFNGRDNITEITIPAGLTEIGESAFESCKYLTTVNFLESAAGEQSVPLTIGDKAFYNCLAIVSIELPARTVSVGDDCFRRYGTEKSKLKTVVLNEGLQTIGAGAFNSCDELESIIIPSTVTEIGMRAFASDGKLANVTFTECSDSNIVPLTLGTYVFQTCSALKTVVLREGTTNIPQHAFDNCKALESITIPATVANDNNTGTRAIDSYAFNSCSALTNITFAQGGELPLSFAREVFNGCISLKELKLPKRISGFGGTYDIFELGRTNNASENNYANMSFGASPAKYVADASAKTYVIEKYTVAEDGGDFWSYDGVLYTADKKTVVMCPFGREGAVTIAKEATSFREGAFFGCQFVTEIKFEDGGTEPLEIGDADNDNIGTSKRVFFACPRLTKIEFPARLKSIGDYAFCSHVTYKSGTVYPYSNGLTDVSFADGCRVEKIGRNAFAATKITTFTLPASVTEVGESVFADGSTSVKSVLATLYLPVNVSAETICNITKGASALKTIAFGENGDGTPTEVCIDNGVVLNNEKTLIAYVLPNAKATLKSYEVPATVTKISDNAFKDITALTALTFEATAEGEEEKPLEIGLYAFSGTGITSVTLPKRIKKTDSYIFYNCKSLASLQFEKGYSCAIPDYAFQNAALTQVALPGDIVSIGRSAFASNAKLTTVTFGLTANGEVSQLKEIGADVFNSCTKLVLLRLEKTTPNEDGTAAYEDDKLPALTALGVSGAYRNGPFKACTSLKSITIPDEVTVIGGSAFDGCTSLVTVNLPKDLKTVYSSAFNGCKKLTTVTFNKETPDATVNLQQKVFNGCSVLTGFDFDKVGEFSGSDIFNGCKALKSVDIHNQLTAGVLKNMFKGCTGLTTVNFDPLSGGIGDSAFNGCTNLTTVTIGENVTKINANAFDGCKKLATVNMNSASLTEIGNYAFQNCIVLKSFEFPATLQEIGNGAFAGTSALAVVDLSQTNGLTIKNTAFKNGGVTTLKLGGTKFIGESAFEACTKLTSVVIPDNFLDTTASKLNRRIFKGCTALTTVDYQSKLDIPEEMFIGCTALTTVTISGNVQNIITKAFSGCTNLTNVTMGNQLQSIGQYAFQNCVALTEVDLPGSLTDIGANAFNGCKKLAKITVNSAIDIGGEAFTGCSDNLELKIKDGVDMDFVDKAIYKGNTLVSYIGKAESLTVKEGTTAIGANAFSGNTTITTVNLPSTVKEIGVAAFKGCTALTTINLEYVTTFGSSAFQNDKQLSFTNLVLNASELPSYLFDACTSITNVTFGVGNVDVGSYAFRGCSGITKMVNTVNVTSLNEYAFQNAFAETAELDLDFSAAKTGYRAGRIFDGAKGLKSIKISGIMVDKSGNNNYYIYDYMFRNCVNLVSVTSVNKVKRVGSNVFNGCTKLTLDDFDMSAVTGIDNQAFINCAAITELNLPRIEYMGTTTLYPTTPIAVFKGCTSLRSVVLGDKITAIGNSVFMNCSSLESVEMPNVNTLCANSFGGCTSLTSLTLTSAVQTVYAGAFSGWTDAQTIRLVDYEEGNLPSGWNAGWANGCNANIIYKRAEAAA